MLKKNIDPEQYGILAAILAIFLAFFTATAMAGTVYSIHCASYKAQREAAADAQKLTAMGYAAFFVPVNLKDKGKWYRVYAGQYETKDKAKMAAKEMVRKKIIGRYFIFPLSHNQTLENKGENSKRTNSLTKKNLRQAERTEDEKSYDGRLVPAGKKQTIAEAKKNQLNSTTRIKDGKQAAAETDPEIITKALGKVQKEAAAEKNAVLRKDKDQIDYEKEEPSTGSSLYDQGVKEMKEKNYEKALITFKEFIDLPDTQKGLGELALRHMADCHFFLGRQGSREHLRIAVGFYKNTLENFPDQKRDNSLTYFRLAQTYEYLKNYVEATINYEKLLAKYPASAHVAEAAFKAGAMLHARGKYSEASNKLIAYLMKYRDGVYAKQAFYLIADCHYKVKQSASAELWFREAQKKWPDLTDIPKEIVMNMGLHKFSLQHYSEAAEIFSFYANLYPNDEKVKEVLLHLADSYKSAEQVSAALTIYNRITIKYPESREAQRSAMEMASLGIDKPNAKVLPVLQNYHYYLYPLAAYDLLLEKSTLGKTAAQVLLQKGKALHKLNRDRAAVDVYVELLKKYPASKMADETRKGLKLVSVALIDAGYGKKDYLAVADIYFEAYRNVPLQEDDYETVHKIAVSLQEIGLIDDSLNLLNDYRNACREEKCRARVTLHIAEVEIARSNYGRAEKIFNELLTQSVVQKSDMIPLIKKKMAEIADRKELSDQAAFGPQAAVPSSQNVHPDLKYWYWLRAGQSYLKNDNVAEARKKFDQIEAGAGPESFWTKIIDYYVSDHQWWDKYSEYLKN